MRKSTVLSKRKVSEAPTVTHEAMVKGWMKDAAFREEVARIEREELALLDVLDRHRETLLVRK